MVMNVQLRQNLRDGRNPFAKTQLAVKFDIDIFAVCSWSFMLCAMFSSSEESSSFSFLPEFPYVMCPEAVQVSIADVTFP